MTTLNEEDKEFMTFWETEGPKRRKWTYMLMHNLPKGIIFSAPIAIFFFLEARRDRAIITQGDLILIMICVFLIAVFYGIFKGFIKLDQNESHYQILKMKQTGQSRPDSDNKSQKQENHA